jgi:hypothetical protein
VTTIHGQSDASKEPLLITESAEEFTTLWEEVEAQLNPGDVIERIYVSNIASLVWEERRLQRSKIALINSAFRQALTDIIKQLARQPGNREAALIDEDVLACSWFVDPAAKAKVNALLNRFGLDVSAIEAEAMRKSASDLEMIDRLMHSIQNRRDKAIIFLAECRRDLGRLLRNVSEKLTDDKVLKTLTGQETSRKDAA